jgi:hypothetical protein
LLLLLGVQAASATPARAAIPGDAQAAVELATDIPTAKTQVANLYDDVLHGRASEAALREAESRLSAMTGEPIQPPSNGARDHLAANYSPFRQVTDYYCGPATVQSILWYLGVRDEGGAANPGAAKGMTGRGDIDQPLLAGPEWLNTEAAQGTDWGGNVPGAINRWRGTNWYASFPAENLTQDQAWRDIQYAIDHGYPVAANVLLGPGTYTPTGFFEGSTYEHWETVVGHFERDGKKWVKVGQVYGTESLGYDPLQEIPWDAYWSAIANWHGIVW